MMILPDSSKACTITDDRCISTQITRLSRLDGKPTGKTFDHRGKTLSPHAGRYRAETLTLRGDTPAAVLGELAGVLGDLRPDQCIILGAATQLPDTYNVLPESELPGIGAHFLGGVPTIARKKEHFAPSRILLLDHDPDDQMPAEWVDADEPARWGMLTQAVPELAGAARLIVPSSSGRVLDASGAAVKARAGVHTYILLDRDITADELDRARTALEARLWAGGLGYIKKSSAGAVLRRALIDTSVWLAGREVFAGPPLVRPPYRRAPVVAPVIHEGGVVAPVLALEATARRAFERQTGTRVDSELRVSDDTSLRMSTRVETKERGIITIKQFLRGPDEKLRCQATFRESRSWAGVLRKTKTGCVLHDSGTATTYRLIPDQIELTGALDKDLVILAGAAEGDAQAVARALIWRHAWRCPHQISWPELRARLLSARPDLDVDDIRELSYWIARRDATAALRPVLIDPAELPRGVEYRPVASIEEARRGIQRAGGGVHLVKASHGTGKTEGILKPLARGVREVAAIAPRKSLVSDLAARLDLAHYEHAVSDPRLAICVNSIINPRYELLEESSLVLIDEVARVVRDAHDRGSTHAEKAGAVWAKLIRLLRGADLAVGADADLGTGDIQMLAREIPQLTVWDVKDRGTDLEAVFGTDDAVMTELHQALAHGARCMVVSDSARRVAGLAEELRARYPERRVLAVHGAAGLATVGTPAAQALLEDINRHAVEYDVLLVSPCVESGVSLTVPHFERHFALYCGRLEPSAFNQQLRRDRTARHWHIGIIGSGMGSAPDSFEAALNSLDAAQRLIRPDGPAIPATEYDADCCRVLAGSRSARNAYARNLWYLLAGRYWRCSRLTPADAKPGRELRRASAEAADLATHEAIQAAPDLRAHERERLKNAARVSPDESAALARAEVREQTGIQVGELSSDDINTWAGGALGGMNRQFDAMTGGVSDHRDRAEHQAGVPLALRSFDLARSRAWQVFMTALGLDPLTGAGELTAESAVAAWEALRSSDEADLIQRFGVARLSGARPPGYAIRWASEALARAGLYLIADRRQGRGGRGGRVYRLALDPLRSLAGKVKLPGLELMRAIQARRGVRVPDESVKVIEPACGTTAGMRDAA